MEAGLPSAASGGGRWLHRRFEVVEVHHSLEGFTHAQVLDLNDDDQVKLRFQAFPNETEWVQRSSERIRPAGKMTWDLIASLKQEVVSSGEEIARLRNLNVVQAQKLALLEPAPRTRKKKKSGAMTESHHNNQRQQHQQQSRAEISRMQADLAASQKELKLARTEIARLSRQLVVAQSRQLVAQEPVPRQPLEPLQAQAAGQLPSTNPATPGKSAVEAVVRFRDTASRQATVSESTLGANQLELQQLRSMARSLARGPPSSAVQRDWMLRLSASLPYFRQLDQSLEQTMRLSEQEPRDEALVPASTSAQRAQERLGELQVLFNEQLCIGGGSRTKAAVCTSRHFDALCAGLVRMQETERSDAEKAGGASGAGRVPAVWEEVWEKGVVPQLRALAQTTCILWLPVPENSNNLAVCDRPLAIEQTLAREYELYDSHFDFLTALSRQSKHGQEYEQRKRELLVKHVLPLNETLWTRIK